MHTISEQQLRKVAILVASLDRAWGERFLAGMPAKQAMQVRNAIEDLGVVDPKEQDEVVREFRQTMPPSTPSASSGVEIDPALLARFEQDEYEPTAQTFVPQNQPFAQITEADTTFIVEMLANEHPQTIAIVLSRLDHDRAVEVLSKFPTTMQAEVLARLADLDATDEQSLRVVEMQVAEWILQQRQRRQRMAAGKDMVERLLDRTPTAQREDILSQLARQNPAMAGKLGAVASRASTKAPATRNPPASSTTAKQRMSDPACWKKATKTFSAQTMASRSSATSSPPAPECEEEMSSENVVAALEQLDDAQLLAALSRCPTRVTHLALAGASDGLLKRVLQQLPRRQANEFRRSLRETGPMRLSDMLSAQRHLLQTAKSLIVHP